MSRPNFFISIQTLNKLLAMEFEGEYQDVELSMDVIEIPYLFVFLPSKEKWILKAILRGDMYLHDETQGIERGYMEIDRETGNGPVRATEELSKNMRAFFQAAINLSKYIQDQHLENIYKDLDPELAGISLIEKDGQLTYEVVEGRKRPDLMCHGMLGGVGMGRPYMDEFMERSALDEMTLEELIKDADSGNTMAMERLAGKYLNGDENTTVDAGKALHWYKKLAEAGDPNGMFNVGLFYAKGFGVKRDFKAAGEWMKKATDAGDEDGRLLAALYEATVDYLERAEQGDANAQALVAKTYMQLAGTLEQAGSEDDFKESVKWAEKAAAQGNGEGCWILALAYEHGRGVKADKKKAFELYAKGAEAGHAGCQHSLGCYYARGEIAVQDDKKAFDLFMKAAAQNYVLAIKDVGRCYQFGTGVQDDMDEAIRWYEKALEIEDDPELARKVELFKHLQTMGQDPDSFESDYEYEGPDLSTRYARIKYLLDSVRMYDGSYYQADGNSDDATTASYDDKTRTVTIHNAELTHTEGARAALIENVRRGDQFTLRADGDTITLLDSRKREIGNYSMLNHAIIPLIENGDTESVYATAVKVIPKSARGKRARKAILDVDVTIRLKEIERAGNVNSIICFTGGDQTNIWVQKIHVVYSSLPLEAAEKMFELYNRMNDEYDDSHTDTGYIGLDNLKDEVQAMRSKIRENKKPGLDYGKISGCEDTYDFTGVIRKAAEREPERYRALSELFGRMQYVDFSGLLEKNTIDEKTYYWVDQTHVSEDEFNNYDGFNHWYDVAMLFAGEELPVDLNDEDVVSVFGTGRCIALADLSYGC